MSRRFDNRTRNKLHRRHQTACRRHIKRGERQQVRRSVRPYLGA